MPKNPNIKKVLVIGSGPIIIGQAAEFDYAGTQACPSLKEEGIEVVLVNSNPATIMTDKDIADEVYIEPLTVKALEQIILKEKPDSILPTLGGQAGLNLAMEIAETDFLEEHNVKLIGTTALTIKKAEDRLMFKETMEKIGEPCAASLVVNNVEDGEAFAAKIGYPVVLRPAYTLGGSGGGIAHNVMELREILENGLRLSRVGEVLVERCIAGWKEIEYEVMRDGNGNCITVCNMENIDPVGVHTGDSIVVAPSQTLSDKEYQMLRTSALNIIDELGITGGCNVQYALNPDSFEYCVIEVNPRVSRSSALASKATGYPIAKVAAKIALGYTLDEIKNAITGKTYASFEPALDYCVVKMPRLPFDKFISAKRTLTTQMKATGEVMSIANNFEGGLMKAIRSLEQHVDSLMSYDFTKLTDEELLEELAVVDDRRIWKIAEGLRRHIPAAKMHEISKIDLWFIDKLQIIVDMENALKRGPLTKELLTEAKRIEFPDNVIGELTGKTEAEVKALRDEYGIHAAFKMVDTCAAEFAAETPYYYSVFGSENEAVETKDKKKVLVLGSGPIRIGQGIEFDFCSVHCTWSFKKEGYETIIVNNNPETVSTDFDIADKLYFEPLTPEDVQNIVDFEKPDGAVVQFGCFPAAKRVTDRFHVQKLAYEAVQEMRVKARWEALDEESIQIAYAKACGKMYHAPVFANGDTRKQLLARSIYLLYKKESLWTQSQRIRAEILFKEYPDIKKGYYMAMRLGSIYHQCKFKDIALTRLARWYDEVDKTGFLTFGRVARSIQTHYMNIINFFERRTTNAAAESFNAKIKAFRAQFRGVRDKAFFLYRLAKLYA